MMETLYGNKNPELPRFSLFVNQNITLNSPSEISKNPGPEARIVKNIVAAQYNTPDIA